MTFRIVLIGLSYFSVKFLTNLNYYSFNSILQWYAIKQDVLSVNHGPGHWNDPDMLLIGNFGLSLGQAKAQMAFWSLLSAPLIISTDLRTIDKQSEEILKNGNLIKINKDYLGRMGKRFSIQNGVELWSKTLADEKMAFVFYNPQTDGTPRKVTISLNDLGLNNQTYGFYESFTGESIGKYDFSKQFQIEVNPAGSVYAFFVEKENIISKGFVQI